MKGIDLSEAFYRAHGAPMLHDLFPEIEELVAVALAGSGSECLGYDDSFSRDHDFEPGFCLFLPGEDVVDRKTAFALERAYAKLPEEFMGFKRSKISPVGGNRHGVIRMSDFFADKTGMPNGELSLKDWFFVPEESLLEATNGKVFRDDLGAFSDIRKRLAYFPEDVRLKKLAGHLLLMGQAGQYNYARSALRGETAAAQLSVIEFVKSTVRVLFLLNRKYMPYYKWIFRALAELPRLSHFSKALEHLISSGNSEAEFKIKQKMIGEICDGVVQELRALNLSDFSGAELEGHAYAVNARIENADIRTRHILYAI